MHDPVISAFADVFLARGPKYTSIGDLLAVVPTGEDASRYPTVTAAALAVARSAFTNTPFLPTPAEQAAGPGLAAIIAHSRAVALRISTDPVVQAGILIVSYRDMYDAELPHPMRRWVQLIESDLRAAFDIGELDELSPVQTHLRAFMLVAQVSGVKSALMAAGDMGDLSVYVEEALRTFLLALGLPADRTKELLDA